MTARSFFPGLVSDQSPDVKGPDVHPVLCQRLRCGWLVPLVLILLGSGTLSAQPKGPTGRFENRTYRDDSGEHRYTVFLPAGFQPERKHPVILFLHGAGERGRDGQKQLTVGLAPYVKAQAGTFPFVVVFPQCEDLEGRLLTSWTAGTSDGLRALEILDEVQQTFQTDPQRTVLMGWSMGGYGAWSLGAAHPERWSAVVALSGGADLDAVSRLKETPVWAFHGTRDKLVPVTESRAAVDALRAAGGQVQYTEFADIGHTPFEETLANEGLIRWMLDPRHAPAALSPTAPRATPLVPAPPFVPALEIPQGVSIRLGNDALHSLSYAAPHLVPANLLSGSLGDMFDSTEAAGRQFAIRFSQISYQGQLERVLVKATAENRLQVQLGLRNIVMTIGATYIDGARHAAQAGPINIGIGHQEAVWLNLDVTPSIDERRFKFRLNGTSFQIPPDNFYVTQPAGVAVQGFGMREDRVSSNLINGLYGSRGRIENEVRQVAPQLVQQLESKLNSTVDTGPLLSGLWPLPVYEPQLKAWPDQIVVDQHGLTLVMGLIAGHPDPFGPVKPVKRAETAGLSPASLADSKSLQVALAPQILQPLTNLLIEEDLGIINVLDIPEKSFGRLADRQVLLDIIPDLARYGETLQTRAFLRLAAPLESGPGADGLQFRLPKLLVTVAINTQPADPHWKHCAEFELDLRQHVQPSLFKPTFSRREVQLGWKPDEQVSSQGRFAAGYAAQDDTLQTEKFVALFRESWSHWTQHNSPAETQVPDLSLGNVRLRISDLTWKAPAIVASFQPAGVRISNLSEVPFTYETRGPHSPFGGPYTLQPGASHEFDIPYPLTYRRQAAGISEVYTLMSGSHAEFRVPKTGGAPRLFQALSP